MKRFKLDITGTTKLLVFGIPLTIIGISLITGATNPSDLFNYPGHDYPIDSCPSK